MGLGEILSKATLNTCLGMGTVFLMLFCISGVIYLLRFIPDKKEKSGETEQTAYKEEREFSDDDETVAVIAAALQAFEEDEKEEESLTKKETVFIARKIRKR